MKLWKRSKHQQLYCLILQVDVLWCHCKLCFSSSFTKRVLIIIKIIFFLIACLYFREQENFISLSFETISGVGPNGAVIHYRYVTRPELLKSSSYVSKQICILTSRVTVRRNKTQFKHAYCQESVSRSRAGVLMWWTRDCIYWLMD